MTLFRRTKGDRFSAPHRHILTAYRVHQLQGQLQSIPSPAYVAKLEKRLKVLEALTTAPVEPEDVDQDDSIAMSTRLNPVEAALKSKMTSLTNELVQLKVR